MSSQQDEVFAGRDESAAGQGTGSEAESASGSGSARAPQPWDAQAPQSWDAPAPQAWAAPAAEPPSPESAAGESAAGESAAGESAAGESAAGESAARRRAAASDPTPTPTFTGPVAPGGAGQALGSDEGFGPDRAVGTAQPAGFGQPGVLGRMARSPWRSTADGKTVFRRGTPFVVFWVWVAFAIYNLIEVIVPDHDYFSLELTFGLLAINGLMYACALRPRLIADDGGILVHNPFRDHLVRWGALNAVYLGDSLELACARPEPKKEKTIYCWALYSGRRSRDRSRMRAVRSQARGFGRGQGTSGRTQAELSDLAKKDTVELMAAELGHRSTSARERGAPDAVLESRWAWLPLACTLAPAAVLLALLLAR